MPNMSHCRFENSLRYLTDCHNHMNEYIDDKEDDCRIELVKLCVEIALDYGHEVGRNLVEETDDNDFGDGDPDYLM